MKLTAVLILATLLQVSAATYAQKLNYTHKNASLEEIFKQIRKQTGYNILVSSDVLAGGASQNVDFKQTPLKAVLEQVLGNAHLTYEIDNKDILIKQMPIVAKEQLNLPASPYVIQGQVFGDNNLPLVGATIMLKGHKNITTSGQGGLFSLSVDLENNELKKLILKVSYIGYDPTEEKVDEKLDRQVINLKRSVSQLDQIQIVAYGETTERYNTGSTSQVNAKDIAEQPVTNPLAALEGRVPGLVITQSSGLPGSSYQAQIRGQNSLTSSPGSIIAPDNPLFIIDGVPIAAQNGNINQFSSIASPGNFTTNSLGGMSVLNSLNPQDIESIEVLRDADATSIYGSRGANGVILITTKRGKAGKTLVSGNFWSGDSKATRTMPLMNTEQYLQMRRQAIANDGGTPQVTSPYSPDYAPDILTFDTTANKNWKKYLYGNTAHSTDANASVSGGNANTTFLIGTGYHRETYVVPGDFSDNRISFNANLHHVSENKKFTLDFSTNYGYDQNNSSGSAQNVSTAFVLPPDYPALLNPDGSLKWSYDGLAYDAFKGNPIAYLQKSYNITNANLISHLQLDYQIITGLNVRVSMGYNTTDVNETSLTPIAAQDPTYSVPSASSSFATNNFKTWIIEPQAEYKRTISKGKLDLLVGGTFQKNTNNSTQINASNISNDALIQSLSAAEFLYASNSYTLYKYNAAFARANYIWDSQLILNLTGRRDGSSRFGPGKQFGDFGSIGTGWIFSENSFIRNNLSFVSYGKIHGSYGTTGSDVIGDYQYTANWTATTGTNYQGSTGYTPQNLYNPSFSWAVDKKLEGGITLGLLKDRILIDATWYRDRSSNQLVSYNLPIQSGFANVLENFPATVQNTGVELQINTKNIVGQKFSWTSSFNLTVPRNVLLAFPGLANSSYASTYVVGQSINIIEGFKSAGVNPTTGVYQFLSANGTPTYSPKFGVASLGGDEQVIGNNAPKFYGGFRNSFTYGRFSVDFFFQYTKQTGYNYLGQIYKSGALVGGISNLPTAFLSAWTKPGQNTSIEQLTDNFSSPAAGAAYTFGNSSGAISDASFIRLKTASLSYSINSDYLKKIDIASCRVYLNAQNLLTITDYKGNDPETQDIYGLPPLKTIVLGLQFTF